MPQTPNQQDAAKAVAAWLAHFQKSKAWLVQRSGADRGTIDDFLSGTRWLQVRTQGKIENALGWPAGSIRQIADGGPAPELAASEETSPGGHGDQNRAVGEKWPWPEAIQQAMLYVIDLLTEAGGDEGVALLKNTEHFLAGDVNEQVWQAANTTLAARRGGSSGQAARREQDHAAERSQDPGGMEPS